MRLLPGGPDHDGCRTAEAESQTFYGRDRRYHAWQYLPLRSIPSHSRSRKTGKYQNLINMSTLHTSRRNFIKLASLTGSGLILGFNWFEAEAQVPDHPAD